MPSKIADYFVFTSRFLCSTLAILATFQICVFAPTAFAFGSLLSTARILARTNLRK